MREYSGTDDDIYGPSVPHFQGKKVHQKVRHVEPIAVTDIPKGIFDRYKKFTLCCDLMHINGIGFLNTTSQNILFATGSMIKTKK